jgi:hypothetical protein
MGLKIATWNQTSYSPQTYLLLLHPAVKKEEEEKENLNKEGPEQFPV